MIHSKFIKFLQDSQKLALVFCAQLAWSQAEAARPQVVFLYVTDLHSHLRVNPDDRGGYARLATLIKSEKAKAGPHQDVIAIGGGDLIDKGALPCRRSQERACIGLLSKMGLDVAVFGNHELSKNLKDLNELITQSGLAWFSPNVSAATGKEQKWSSDIVWKAPKSGQEFYLITWTLLPGPKEWDPKKFQMRGELKWNEAYWKTWKEKSAERPVLLVPHQSFDDDVKFLSKACESFGKGQVLALFKGNDDIERVVPNKGCAPILEPQPYGKSLVKMIFEKQDDGSWKALKHEFLVADAQVKEDPEIKTEIEKLYAKLAPDADDKVFEMSAELNNTAIAHWLAQTYQKVSKADLAIVNTGATKQSFQKGAVTREELFYSVPYNNSLKGFDISRKLLEKALCEASRRTRDPHFDEGSDLVLSVGHLEGAGSSDCRLNGIDKGQLKVVIDDFLMKNSRRWLGHDFSSISFSFGMNTEQVLHLAMKRDASR